MLGASLSVAVWYARRVDSIGRTTPESPISSTRVVYPTREVKVNFVGVVPSWNPVESTNPVRSPLVSRSYRVIRPSPASLVRAPVECVYPETFAGECTCVTSPLPSRTTSVPHQSV